VIRLLTSSFTRLTLVGIINVMVAAALTIWMMFSLWLIVPLARLPHVIARVAAILVSVELLALFVWSFGTERCNEATCAPLAQAAGIAARTDIPALSAAFLVFAFVRLWRGQAGARRAPFVGSRARS